MACNILIQMWILRVNEDVPERGFSLAAELDDPGS